MVSFLSHSYWIVDKAPWSPQMLKAEKVLSLIWWQIWEAAVCLHQLWRSKPMIGKGLCAVAGEDNFLVSLWLCSLLIWHFIQHFVVLEMDSNQPISKSSCWRWRSGCIISFSNQKSVFLPSLIITACIQWHLVDSGLFCCCFWFVCGFCCCLFNYVFSYRKVIL